MHQWDIQARPLCLQVRGQDVDNKPCDGLVRLDLCKRHWAFIT